jgi:hypothetical protein
MTTNLIKSISLFTLLVLGVACKNRNPDVPVSKFQDAAFVMNQGQFPGGAGSVSYLNKTNSQITRDMNADAGNPVMGSVVQSMCIRNNNEAYVVVNNSGVIRHVDLDNFRLQRTLGDLSYPRYMKFVEEYKAYITEWTDSATASRLAVYDNIKGTYTKRIWLPVGAEEIAVVGNRAYISCNGAFGNNDKLAVIDIAKDSLVAVLTVGPNPDGLQVDAEQNLWILCSGQWNSGFTQLDNTGKLLRYNAITNTVDRTINLSSLYSQPQDLKLNGAKNTLYFNYDGGVYSMPITGSSISGPIVNGYFYGLGIDPNNGDIYCSDARDFSSNGFLRRYTAAGVKKDSFVVGIAPGEIEFFKR